MRLLLTIAVGLLLAAALLVWLYTLSALPVAIPAPPRPSFYHSLKPNAEGDHSFLLQSLTDDEVHLLWADENGLHEVMMRRQDFDRMFGPVRIEPRTPEEQEP